MCAAPAKINDLVIQNAELKGKVEMLEKMLNQVMKMNHFSSPFLTSNDESVKKAFASMTSKQHAAFQMVLRGASNSEIAQRFEVTESTAKVYVKGIMDRLEVRQRSKIISKASNFFDRMDPAEYQILSGGVPKDWDLRYEDYPEVSERLFEKTRGKKGG